MLLSLILLQAAAVSPSPAPADIELNVRARARSVASEQKGEATLAVTAEPDAGSRVEARVAPKAAGRTSLRNVQVDIHAEARIGDGVEIEAAAETSQPQ